MTKLDIRHPMSLPLVTFLVILIAVYTTACSYYRAVSVDKVRLTQSEYYDDLSEFTIYLHEHERIVLLKEAAIENSALTAQAEEVSVNTAPHYDPNFSNKRVKEHNKDILSEMHIYLKPGLNEYYQPPGTKKVDVPLDAVNEVTVIKPNFGLSVLAFLGIVVGILLIVTIIIALTKSSCPYVYAFDGEALIFQGEIYSGANARNLERSDILYLPAIQDYDDKYMVRISNELKEEQYINHTALAVIDHTVGTEVIPDQHGNYHIIENLESPVEVTSSSGIDLNATLLTNDTLFFAFDEPEYFENSVSATFANPNGRTSANLVLELKNSIWGDHVVAEFQALFGKRYDKWRNKQEKLTPEERRALVDSSGMLLGVFIRDEDAWHHVEDIYFVGPLGQRKLVVPLNLNGKSQAEVKLRSGYRFWDLNSLKISYDTTTPDEIQYPAFTDVSNKVQKLLRATDEKYLKQLHTGDFVDISWTVPEQGNSMTRSVFLECSGYYLPVRKFEGDPDIAQLEKFKQPGYFSEFSRAKYEEIEEIKVTIVSTPAEYE